jgi:hypothetical protein
MYMPFLVLRKNYFSETVRGGDITADIGFVQNTMSTDGPIIVVIHLGINKYLVIGGIVTEIIGGVVIPGILVTSLTAILIIIGAAAIGVMTMDGDVLAVERVDMLVERAEVAYTVVEQMDMVVERVVEKVEMAYMAVERAAERVDAPIPMGE